MADDQKDPPSIQADATQLMGQIPFGAILSAPLMAAVSAQAAAAQACVDFIKSVGLDNDGKVKSTQFKFVRSVTPPPDAEAKARAALNPPVKAGDQLTDDQQRQVAEAIQKQSSSMTLLEVPNLSMLPIPFIRIDNLTIAMKTSVTATTESSQTTSANKTLEGKADGSVGWGPVKVGFSGGISSKKDSTATSTSKYSVEQTIDVNIHATQDDMPAGLAKVLNILVENIHTVPQS